MKQDTRTTATARAYDSSETVGTLTAGEKGKKDWVQQYADRMFALWLKRQTCLGIARHYLEQLREDLEKWYDDPLKKMFIEATY